MIGEDFIATHMAWGAINEWCAHSAYTRLIQAEDPPVLTEILRRIAKQETRHVAFYNSQARERLECSKKAQRIARFALTRAWGIVGSTLMPPTEVKHMLTYLYGGEQGLAEVRRIDAKIDALPGVQGLHLVERNSSSTAWWRLSPQSAAAGGWVCGPVVVIRPAHVCPGIAAPPSPDLRPVSPPLNGTGSRSGATIRR